MESMTTRASIWLVAPFAPGRILLFAVLALTVLGPVSPARGQGIFFDDSDPDILVLGNSTFYEVGVRRSNGSIAFITDKTTGEQVSLGSRGQCLWVAEFSDRVSGLADYVGGCHFSAPDEFSFSWSPEASTLTLDYDPGPAAKEQVSVQVTVTVSEDPWFDLRLEVRNDSQQVLANFLFPADLVFQEGDLEEVLLPVLPGVVLEPGFFEEDRYYTAKYPGAPGIFADYVSLSSTRGRMAIYSIFRETFQQLELGFIHDDAYVADSTFYRHAFAVKLAPGEEWWSPPVRVRVSQPAFDTIRAYREDNRLDQFPSLADKLGSRLTEVLRSPLVKADMEQLGIPFSEYADKLSTVPTPAILHPVAFQPLGFDRHYPDFLPPDPAWGTTEEMAEMFQHAQARGFLVMPYINPTWWNADSPTLQGLPPWIQLKDVAALDAKYNPIWQCFNERCGYVVSPHAPFVRQRLDELMTSLTKDVPSDMIFEDQIGARRWVCDHNHSAPDPLSYVEGWLEHTRTYSDLLLMTELGFDRLAETEVGFHGSVLLSEKLGDTDDDWGAGNWRPYPLAPLMVRDKVLFYQHDLAPHTFTFEKETLTWNLAFGFMLSHNLFQEPGFGGGCDTDWLRLVALFQRVVLARYGEEEITDFRNLSPHVTETSFETFKVIANWDDASDFATDGNVIPPRGVQVKSTGGDVTAGVFSSYTGMPLTSEEHYLIEVRHCHEIKVYQPVGPDTPLTLGLRPEWGPGDSIVVVAFTAAGDPIREVPSTVTDQNVTFDYQGEVDGLPVGFYTMSAESSVFCDGFESGNTAAWDQVSADPPRRPGRPFKGLNNDDQELNGPARGAGRYSREPQRTAADLGRSSAELDGPSVGPGRKAPGLKGPSGGYGCRVLSARRGGGHE